MEKERNSLEASNAAVRGVLDQNAPVGSRWTSHPDTERLLGQINQNNARVREIDRELKE